jgi:hypothetical protein
MRKLLYIFLFLIPLTADTAALITGMVFIDTKLLDEPSNNSQLIENLAAKSQVTVQQRQNSWTQVATTTNTGWVPTLTIRIVSVSQQSSVDGASNVAVERLSGTNQKTVVATFGIRGIDEETLKDAELSEEQLALLETYQVSEQQAKTYARAGDLKAKNVAYFDVTVDLER